MNVNGTSSLSHHGAFISCGLKKIVWFQKISRTPLPLGISSGLAWGGGYGYFLEPHIVLFVHQFGKIGSMFTDMMLVMINFPPTPPPIKFKFWLI